MNIGGLQKTTLLDFPGRVSALVFTQGCNFHCPYCHNPELHALRPGTFSCRDVLAYLEKRAQVLEGLVISGGEPCLHDDLPAFCRQVKNLGYAVKLDSNGSRPEMLENLLAEGLLDYIAMDIKADPLAYPESLCDPALRPAIARSARLIRQSGLEHEFRVTCVYPFSNNELPEAMTVVCADSPIFFQAARLEHVLDPSFFAKSGYALAAEEIDRLVQAGVALGLNARPRGQPGQ